MKIFNKTYILGKKYTFNLTRREYNTVLRNNNVKTDNESIEDNINSVFLTSLSIGFAVLLSLDFLSDYGTERYYEYKRFIYRLILSVVIFFLLFTTICVLV